MLENGVFNRPYVRDITKICECACSMNCDKNATELRPDRNPDIITNADRIRAMSDTGLAKLFYSVYKRSCIDFVNQSGINAEIKFENSEDSEAVFLKYLQSPAEEDT